MDSSFLSLLIFIIITILYYLVIKVPLTTTIIDNDANFVEYTSANNIRLVIYFLLVVLTQFGLNAGIIMNKCGGSVQNNIGSAFIMTFIPWIFIFGILIVVLIVFPGFKSAFSNVVGYFAVSGRATNILTELLENTDLSKTINDATGDSDKKNSLKSAAEAIIKLCGNMSILINQIVPSNFNEYWAMLAPLMKDKYQMDNMPIQLKQELLDTVVMRDNIGEALWYVYTAVLLISITQYNIATKKCVQDLASLEANQQEYQAEQAKLEEANKQSESSVYTL